MELAFVTNWPKTDVNLCIKKLLGDYVCSLSCRNTFAFTAIASCKNADTKEEREIFIPQVHIIDPDRPWERYSNTGDHKDPITLLEWESTGTRLLSGDAGGRIVLWQMKNHMLNDWSCSTETHISGEPIVATSWLHGVSKLYYDVDNIECPNWLEVFKHIPFQPSLKLHGSSHAEGWIAVTTQGMVTVKLLNLKGESEVSQRLSQTRPIHVAVADIAFQSSGHILIAVADGSTRLPVHVFRITLKWERNKCTMKIDQLPSYFVRCCLDFNTREKYPTISHLKFLNKECMKPQIGSRATEQLVVCASGSNGSCIEICTLEKEPNPLNIPQVFQSTQMNRDKTSSQLVWMHRASHTDISTVSAIAMPRLPLNLSSKIYNGPGMCLAVTNVDGTIKLLHRLTLRLCDAFKYEKVKPDSQGKRQKVLQGKHVVCMEMSNSCCALMGVDRAGSVCLFRIRPMLGQSVDQGALRAHTISVVVNLFVYCLVTGFDQWDVILRVTPNMVEAILDKLTNGFKNQPKATQELLMMKFMSTRAALYRIAASVSGKATDSFGKLILLSTANVIRSQLQPTSHSPVKKGPSDQLSSICSANADLDVDKLRANLDPRDFDIETSTLRSLHAPIEFLVNLAILVLTAIHPQSHQYHKPGTHHYHKTGVLILKDSSTLELFRELLLLLRIWSQDKSNAFPVFPTTVDSIDAIPHIYRLITQFWLCCKDENQHTEPSEELIDECVLLASYVQVPCWEFFPVTEGILGKLHSPHGSRNFQFDTGPGSLISIVTFGMGPEKFTRSTMDMLDRNHTKTDIISGRFIGTFPSQELRRCSRCSSLSLLPTPEQLSVSKPWEHNWVRTCICGGLWKRVLKK
ncbi:mediator of RNA polymerase II transcription subunit 16-like isoform X2 [Apostichopus japonicus]|uniref:mediator of RNA polymerase II transcription subunit 16-like isoform X2 n=1 Tax=Stichopus japonicus TaxID=307972 RepID=UPI003AB1570B